MENAADALKMAGWVLIFVVALSICINAFSKAKDTMDIILENSDRQTITQHTVGNYDSSGNLITKRTVKFADIVPTIYRAYKENYKVVFLDRSGNPINLYKYRESYNNTYTEKDVNSIDIQESGAYINDTEIPGANGMTVRQYFIARILYGEKGKFKDPNKNARMGVINLTKDEWCEAHLTKIDFSESEGLYRYLKDGQTFTEELGVYYQQEKVQDSEIPEANKIEKRIVTYKLN